MKDKRMSGRVSAERVDKVLASVSEAYEHFSAVGAMCEAECDWSAMPVAWMEWARTTDRHARDIIAALRSYSSLLKENEERGQAIRDVWPHLTGHCFEGATPECFGEMRDRLSAVVDGLPYAEVRR